MKQTTLLVLFMVCTLLSCGQLLFFTWMWPESHLPINICYLTGVCNGAIGVSTMTIIHIKTKEKT